MRPNFCDFTVLWNSRALNFREFWFQEFLSFKMSPKQSTYRKLLKNAKNSQALNVRKIHVFTNLRENLVLYSNPRRTFDWKQKYWEGSPWSSTESGCWLDLQDLDSEIPVCSMSQSHYIIAQVITQHMELSSLLNDTGFYGIIFVSFLHRAWPGNSCDFCRAWPCTISWQESRIQKMD